MMRPLLLAVPVLCLAGCQSAPVRAAMDLLRPAPDPAPAESAVWNPDDAGLNTGVLQRRVWEAQLGGRELGGRELGDLVSEIEPTDDPLAYVNLRGPSDIRDWRMCESRTGGAFVLGPGGGMGVAADFDVCLRALGYLPESEAVQKMVGRTG